MGNTSQSVPPVPPADPAVRRRFHPPRHRPGRAEKGALAGAVRTRLRAVAPDGLLFHSAEAIEMKRSAIPRRAEYRYAPATGVPAAAVDRAAALLGLDKVWVDRLRARPRQLNIRPYLRGI